MNKLAKELGIELKPFCVKTEGLTPQMGQDILDRCVDLGAEPYEVANGAKSTYVPLFYRRNIFNWRFLGIEKHHNSTRFSDYTTFYNYNELTYCEVLDYLQLHEEGGRLVPNENTTKCHEPLKLTLDEIKDQLTTYSFLNERVNTKPISDYLDYVYKLEGNKKERLDNEIKELENTLESKKRERSKL